MEVGSSSSMWFVLVLVLVGFGSSDVDQDKAECGEKLVGLAPCLAYVGGQAEAPTPDCCSELKRVLVNSRKCLCILIKDTDDTKLGLKVNATLAATLPSACHSSANVTECINLLHLAPDSADGKMFKGFANITAGKSSTISSTGNSIGEIKSDGGWRKGISLALKMVCGCGALLWIMASHLIIIHM